MLKRDPSGFKIPIIALNLGALIAENNLYHLKLRIRRKLKCNPVPGSRVLGHEKRDGGDKTKRVKNLASGEGATLETIVILAGVCVCVCVRLCVYMCVCS